MTGESGRNEGDNSPKSTPDLKKLERDDFHNIIGVYHQKQKANKKGRTEKLKDQMSKRSTLQKSTVYERYNFGNLEELLVDSKEDADNADKATGRKALNNNSEPDNDKFHQLYDNYGDNRDQSEDMYKMYEQMNDTEEDRMIAPDQL